MRSYRLMALLLALPTVFLVAFAVTNLRGDSSEFCAWGAAPDASGNCAPDPRCDAAAEIQPHGICGPLSGHPGVRVYDWR